MKRRLFNILSALSLAIFATLVVLWVRSYFVVEGIAYVIPHQRGPGYLSVYVIPAHGSIHVDSVDGPTPLLASERSGIQYERVGVRHGDMSAFGCFAFYRVLNASGYYWIVRFPYWPLVVLMGALPTAWLVRDRKRRRELKRGHCLRCGYDLRARKERCPECGTAMPMKAMVP